MMKQVTAFVLIICLLTLTKALAYLPMAILAAIVIAAGNKNNKLKILKNNFFFEKDLPSSTLMKPLICGKQAKKN